MADKSTRLILEALTQAAAAPSRLPLFAGKSHPGLFPATAGARQAAKRCQDDGLIRVEAGDASRAEREVCVVTDKGLDWLLSESSPRQVLEDFLRVLEQKQAQTAELIGAARHMASGLESLRGAIERLAPHFRVQSSQPHHLLPRTTPEPNGAGLGTDVVIQLERWHSASSRDCPLPELWRKLQPAHPEISIGRFHDTLRLLHDKNQLYLHPWTGPLYEIPEPPYALLVGHGIAYYASLCVRQNLNSET